MTVTNNQMLQRQPFQLPTFDYNLGSQSPGFLNLDTPVNSQTNLAGVPGTADGNFNLGFDTLNTNNPLTGITNPFDAQIGLDINKRITDPSKNFFNTNVIPGLDALSGLTQAYTGLQQLDLSRDAFDFNKRLSNANLANQADLTTEELQNRTRFAGQGRRASPEEIQASLDALPQLRRSV